MIRTCNAARLAVLVAGAVAFSACAPAKRGDVARAQHAVARELVRTRDWPRAFAVTDALCRSSPRDAEALRLRGVIYREQRLEKEAEADLRESVRLRPKHAETHSALAVLYDVQGRAEDALAHHRKASELDPRNPAYLNNLGFSLFVHGRPREAVPVLEEALRSAPADARVRNNLGFALAASGDLVRAAQQFSMAGTPADAKNNLAWSYERRGTLAQAFDLYVEAVRLDPAARAPRENLERVALALGRAPPPDLPPRPEER